MTDKINYTLTELLEMEYTEIPFLWGQIIPQTGITFLTGSSDCNKSTFLRQLCLSIINGHVEFLGLPLNTIQNRVLYISTEDTAEALSPLLKKQTDGNSCLPCNDNLEFVFASDSFKNKLDEALEKSPLDLIVIDGWLDTFKGDINQANSVRGDLNFYSNLSQKHKCAFVMVHHMKKGIDERNSHKGDMLGSQGIEAKARTVIELKKESANIRVLKVLKGNYTPESVKATQLLLSIDENLVFSYKGIRNTTGFDFSNDASKLELKQKIQTDIVKLKEGGLSFAKIKEEISKEHGDNVPGLTSIKNWYHEQKNNIDSESNPKLDENEIIEIEINSKNSQSE